MYAIYIMNFQEIVIYVALVVMIIALIVVFMMLYYSSDKNRFHLLLESVLIFL